MLGCPATRHRNAVEGHTDSVQGEVDNQELSSNRAETADVIAEVRPDLELHVEGYADTKPAEQENGSDDDEARKANRRVGAPLRIVPDPGIRWLPLLSGRNAMGTVAAHIEYCHGQRS